MTYKVTIKIAEAGTPIIPSQPGGSFKSDTGHMWFSVDDGQGNLHNGGKPKSFGFAPIKTEAVGPGWVNGTPEKTVYDDDHYLDTAYEKTIELTKEQYETLMDYGQNPEKYGFDKEYHGVLNSCIDYVYKGLDVVGLNPFDTEGLLWPTWNENLLDAIGRWNHLNNSLVNGTPFDPLFNYFDHFFGGGLDVNGIHLDFAKKATQGTLRMDPLAFDLGGFHGIDTTGKNNGVLFDHNADGVKNGTGWVREYDAWLALDKDGNGTIDSGRELFGDNTIKSNGERAQNGFDALADWDVNEDGVIDAQDEIFTELRLWRDANQDGISQSEELLTLSDLNIASINLQNTKNNTNLDGTSNVQTLAANLFILF